ncbi:MAG TPA: protein kinase [Longimicrobiales bacterium]
MLTSIRAALAGHYVLEREIGHGSAAVVYAARDLKHGRAVALKVLRPEVVNALGTRRFLQEIRTTARLSHPNILPLFDSGEAGEFLYYTMPLVRGESLRDRMVRQGRMPLHVALPLLRQIASALTYAHSERIVHRDIKPENVLIGDQEHVWVADFGLARALATASDQRLTGTAMAVGSPLYISPEQAAGQTDVDARSDIYSLGCITFELLCGEPPFTAATVPALLARHMSEPPPSIRACCPSLPAGIDDVLGRALAKDRTRRFADAVEFAGMLELQVDRRAPAAPAAGASPVAAPVAVPERDSLPPRSAGGGGKLERMRLLLDELMRRKVVTVVLAYAAAAAGAMQVVDVIAPRMNLPDAAVSMVILLAAAGLPLAAMLAWLYDRSAEGRSFERRDAAEPVAAAAVEAPVVDAAPPAWHGAALPTAATPFIGREEELRELQEMLRSSPCRLVTVTGTGGVGKTRLALHTAAAEAARYRDGAAYVALSGLAAPELLVPALAESLGIQLSRRNDPLDEVKAFLRDKELLFVVDNFEHMRSEAAVLPALLDHAPGLRLLVTSRERLDLRHETLITLGGLPLSGGDGMSDAEKLFVAGAQRLDRHFQLDDDNRGYVARICALLGGIPLAIELASTWVRALSCAEILAEIRRDLDTLSSEAPDLEARHRSLRATFDASWRLLQPYEQAALLRLAVFRSSFDRAAAEQVAAADAQLLRQLVDKSLLTRAGDRLLMLDVVRAYALQRLSADPVMERHAQERHLACLTEVLRSLQHGAQRGEATAIARIAAAIDDVRAAWSYATQSSNTTALLRAMDGLFYFYEVRGWAREGADAFARASAAVGRSGQPTSRLARLAATRLDARHAVFLHRLGELRDAESLLRRAAAALRELEEPADLSFALHRLGAVRHEMGDYGEAERLHSEARSLAQQLNDRLAVGWSMTYLGNVSWSRGEIDAATRLYTEALELLREEHDLNGMWVTLNNLGVIAATREQYEEARRRFREGLALQSELRNDRFKAYALHNLGSTARDLGDLAQARQWLTESLEISERMGYESMVGLTLVQLADLGIREGDESGALAALHRALRSAVVMRNDPLALEALLNVARLRKRQGDRPGALELATAIAVHPGSDDDARRRATELIEQLGGRQQQSPDVSDLATLIEGVLSAGPGMPMVGAAAVPRRPHTFHAETTGDS